MSIPRHPAAADEVLPASHTQEAFGISILSNLPIPGLSAAVRPGADPVRVHLGAIPAEAREQAMPDGVPESRPAGAGVQLWTGASGYRRFRFADGCEAVVDAAARRVWCAWPPGMTLEDACIYLMGPVFATVLRAHGRGVLHAAALRTAAGAVLLAGPPGAGKSTTAAALALAGAAVMGDDVAALSASPGKAPLTHPSPPRIRLWDEATRALFGAEHALPLLTDNWGKRFLQLESTPAGPMPVRGVYILADREGGARAPRAEPLPPREALLALVGNAYHGWLASRAERATEFALFGALVRNCPVRRLIPRDDPAALDGLVTLILSDINEHG